MSEPMDIDLEAFWSLIDQAKEHQGDADEWLKEQLIAQGEERAIVFDVISGVYRSLAHQYGIWCAASVIDESCTTNSGFDSFKAWLVGQGREVYMAALKDPDSLTDVPACDNYYFESLGYVGDLTYAKLTGRDGYSSFDRNTYQALVDELKKDVVYGEGIDYPYTWSETAAYLPRLCAKYLAPERLAWLIQNHDDTWNVTSPDIQEARATAQKSKKVKKNRGESR